MTNAEKYLKDGADIEEFINDLHYFWWANEYDVCDGIRKFLSAEAKKKKPQLTEDERVILKYVDGEYTHIQRADGLWLIHYEDEYTVHQMSFEMYSHLFQFIKNGEEYSIEELLGDEKQ